MELGATFVARSFSGDKDQLIPLIKAAISHSGFALIDVVSPCVTFNNTATSTKSYEFVRDHIEATGKTDFIPVKQEIMADYEPGYTQEVTLHDGSVIHLYKKDEDLDLHNRLSAIQAIHKCKEKGEILTGLLYLDPDCEDLHEIVGTVEKPLRDLDETALCPGSKSLDAINQSLR